MSIFDMILANEIQIKDKCAPRTKIVAHPWSKSMTLYFSDFNGSDPPIRCGFSVDTGKDKVCCKPGKPRTITPVAKKYG